MFDTAYFIESADIRLPNACPELPDMENEKVSKPGLRACKKCGKGFVEKNKSFRYCPECRRKRDGHITVCEVCGKEFRQYSNGRNIMCRECRALDGTYKLPERVMTTESVKDANRKAAQKGMSYGQYMARYGKRGERH